MGAISSAQPLALVAYARAGNDLVVILETEAQRIEAALAPFRSRCTEYRVHEIDGLAARIGAYGRAEGELAARTGGVAMAFQHADSGQLRGRIDDLALLALITAQAFQAHASPRDQALAHAGVWGAISLRETLYLLRTMGVIARSRGADDAILYGGLAAWRALGALSALPGAALHEFADSYTSLMWNWTALRLILIARFANGALERSGPLAPFTALLLLPILAPYALLCGQDALALIIVGDGPRWANEPIGESGDLLDLLLQGFWNEGVGHIDPPLFQAFTAELDRLLLVQCRQTGSCTGPGRDWTLGQGERITDIATGALDVSVQEAFPWSTRGDAGGTGAFQPRPADSMAGNHSGISYFPGEQVRLERLNAGTSEYRISIAGLDPGRPAYNNNMEAVAQTSRGITEGNRYYEEVRARFLADLERIPPGSTLHMEGHSMGGGMCFLLRNDPEVQRRLVEAGITVGSVITFGAVRPRGPAGEPPEETDGPFAGAEERNYVNVDDSLAWNVGAGHEGDPTVIVLDNGRPDEPATAHNDYGNDANYANLPPDLLALPYTVDPATYAAYAELHRISVAPPDTPSIPAWRVAEGEPEEPAPE